MIFFFVLIQLRFNTSSTGLPSPAMMLFNSPINTLLPQIGRVPINIINADDYHEVLKSRSRAYTMNDDTQKESTFLSAGSTVAVQMGRWGSLDAWCDHWLQQ